MKLERLSNAEWITSISALLLLASMFLDWFGTRSSEESIQLFSVGHNAWEALDFIPIVLLITVVAALAAATLRLAGVLHTLPIPLVAVVAALGLASTLLILFRIINPPDLGGFGTSFGPVVSEGTVQLPIFLALGAAAGIAFGGYRAMRERQAERAA